MKVCGIIVEYNPFHNGHIYHIQEARKKTQCDILIAVMSGHFTQRGEPAITNKWERTLCALNHGVDIVIELPFNYACQSADYFAYAAVFLLNAMKVDTIVFGSESNNSNQLIEIARAIYSNEEQYNQLVKKYMNDGIRYPSACNQALKTILNKEITLPNDLLALSYIKEIVKNKYAINPISIQRTNHFHDTSLTESISSATSIRKAVLNNLDVTNFTPMSNVLYTNPVDINQYFDLLYYKLMTEQDLSDIHLVEEGIDNLMKKKITQVSSINELVESMTSKRYTASRIKRTIISVLLNQKEGLYTIDYIRILGMNAKGRKYINQIKKNSPLKIISNFANHKSPLLDLELLSTKLYACVLPLEKRQELIEREYKGHPIIIK